MVWVNTFFIIAFGFNHAVLSDIHVIEDEVSEVEPSPKGVKNWRVVGERSFPLVTD